MQHPPPTSSTTTATATAASSDPPKAAAPASSLVQYVVVRTDLRSGARPWPLGAIVAVACHASVAAIADSLDAQCTRDYLAELDSMHKVTLGVSSEESLRSLEFELVKAGVKHKLWIEQPEGLAVALATAPDERTKLKPFFAALKLLK